jgi:hypothetical protein
MRRNKVKAYNSIINSEKHNDLKLSESVNI